MNRADFSTAAPVNSNEKHILEKENTKKKKKKVFLKSLSEKSKSYF